MLNPLRIQATGESLEVNLDREMGRFEFYGKSLPEDPNEFFKPVIDWFKEYVASPNKETVVVFKMEYVNTASSKKILDILTLCFEIHKKKQSIIVNWFYRYNDEDMHETGETFSEIVHIPFKFMTF
ncbi:MAG: DUF1987 domain-containing protein [Tenuifilaceae bacterium]